MIGTIWKNYYSNLLPSYSLPSRKGVLTSSSLYEREGWGELYRECPLFLEEGVRVR
jgi:hypothetical protein